MTKSNQCFIQVEPRGYLFPAFRAKNKATKLVTQVSSLIDNPWTANLKAYYNVVSQFWRNSNNGRTRTAVFHTKARDTRVRRWSLTTKLVSSGTHMNWAAGVNKQTKGHYSRPSIYCKMKLDNSKQRTKHNNSLIELYCDPKVTLITRLA